MATSPLVNIDALNTVYEAICNQFKEKVYTTTANPNEVLGTSSAHYSQAYIDAITARSWSISSAGAASFNSTLNVGGNSTLRGTLSVTNATTLNNTLTVSGNSTLRGTVTLTSQLILGTNILFPDGVYYNDVRESDGSGSSTNGNVDANQLASSRWVVDYCGVALNDLEQQIEGSVNPQIEELQYSVFGGRGTRRTDGKIINNNETNAGSSSDTNAAIYTPGGLAVTKDIYAGSIHNAIWNDLADCIPVPEDTELEYGYCYKFDGENYTKTSNYSDSQFIGIHSDTAGFYMGERPTKTLKVSVAGFVLAYVDKLYKPGTLLTCTKDGKLTKANLFTRLFKPHSIIASFWKDETEEEWGPSSRKIKVNGRKWVKIK